MKQVYFFRTHILETAGLVSANIFLLFKNSVALPEPSMKCSVVEPIFRLTFTPGRT